MYKDDISKLTKILKIQANVISERYNIDRNTVLADIQKDVIDAKFDKATYTTKVTKVAKKIDKITKRFFAIINFISFWNGVPVGLNYAVVQMLLEKEIERRSKNE